MKKFILLAIFAGYAFAGDLPDPNLTPGATNPNVTQANIQQTICVSGWTKTVRPPASYTNKLKASQLPSDSDLSMWEEDHLISIELGGNPTDPRNLWPQLWDGEWGAHKKDQLENKLKKLVCAGRIPLAEAQKAIATDWKAAYQKYMPMK